MNYPENINICPNCKSKLLDSNYEYDRNRINERLKEVKLNKKVKRANLLIIISLLTFSIYSIVDSILFSKICDYYGTFTKHLTPAISQLVLIITLRWVEFKHTFFSNVIYVILIILFAIYAKEYISIPLTSQIWGGDYLYNEYWLVYSLNNIIVIIESIFFVFDDSYHVATSKNKINFNIVKYICITFIILLVVIAIIDIVSIII